MKLNYQQNWWFYEFHTPLNANVLFCPCFLNSPRLWPNSGFRYCLFLALLTSLLSVFQYFSRDALVLSSDASLCCPDTNFLPYCTLFGCVRDTKRHISVYYMAKVCITGPKFVSGHYPSFSHKDGSRKEQTKKKRVLQAPIWDGNSAPNKRRFLYQFSNSCRENVK
jgi:hypothetical protein